MTVGFAQTRTEMSITICFSGKAQAMREADKLTA
jgi:hypothetical protein